MQHFISETSDAKISMTTLLTHTLTALFFKPKNKKLTIDSKFKTKDLSKYKSLTKDDQMLIYVLFYYYCTIQQIVRLKCIQSTDHCRKNHNFLKDYEWLICLLADW